MRSLECAHYVVRLGNDGPGRRELQGREHPRRDELSVPSLLLAIAEHRDLADGVRNAFGFEPQHNLERRATSYTRVPTYGDWRSAAPFHNKDTT